MSSNGLILASSSTLVQTHQDHKYPLVLIDGNLQPADVHVWEQVANHYFSKMKVVDVEKVPSVFTSFHNLRIMNWIEGLRDTMTADGYTFTTFMKDLCENFLESGWARKMYRAEIK